MSELSTCPTCGEHAELERDNKVFAGQNYTKYPPDVARQSHGYHIRCAFCGLQTCWWHYKAEAIKAWESRPVIDQLRKEVENERFERQQLAQGWAKDLVKIEQLRAELKQIKRRYYDLLSEDEKQFISLCKKVPWITGEVDQRVITLSG